MSHPVIDRISQLSAAFATRVDGVTDWSAASPCEGWTARDVVAHVTNGYRSLAAGGSAAEVGPDEDIAAAFHSARSAMLEALAQPGALEAVAPGPMGPMPVEQLVGRLICTDTLVHTWDLARATGQDETLDADAVAGGYSGLKPMDAMIRRPGVFSDKVPAPEGADLQTEFLSFLGRKV